MDNKLGAGIAIAGIWLAVGVVGYANPEFAVQVAIPAAWATFAVAFFLCFTNY